MDKIWSPKSILQILWVLGHENNSRYLLTQIWQDPEDKTFDFDVEISPNAMTTDNIFFGDEDDHYYPRGTRALQMLDPLFISNPQELEAKFRIWKLCLELKSVNPHDARTVGEDFLKLSEKYPVEFSLNRDLLRKEVKRIFDTHPFFALPNLEEENLDFQGSEIYEPEENFEGGVEIRKLGGDSGEDGMIEESSKNSQLFGQRAAPAPESKVTQHDPYAKGEPPPKQPKIRIGPNGMPLELPEIPPFKPKASRVPPPKTPPIQAPPPSVKPALTVDTNLPQPEERVEIIEPTPQKFVSPAQIGSLEDESSQQQQPQDWRQQPQQQQQSGPHNGVVNQHHSVVMTDFVYDQSGHHNGVVNQHQQQLSPYQVEQMQQQYQQQQMRFVQQFTGQTARPGSHPQMYVHQQMGLTQAQIQAQTQALMETTQRIAWQQQQQQATHHLYSQPIYVPAEAVVGFHQNGFSPAQFNHQLGTHGRGKHHHRNQRREKWEYGNRQRQGNSF